MKRTDLIIITILLFAGIFFALIYFLSRSEGGVVCVKIGDNVVDRISLSEDIEKTYHIDDEENTLVIKDGEAYVINASCPDKLCEKMGAISHTNETIVCLPHKFFVTIEGGEAAEFDAVTR